MSRSVRTLLVVLGVALLYIACAKLGLALAIRAAQVTAVWPPTGFALAAILRLGRRSAIGILLGAFIANATAGEPLWVAGGIAIGNTLEALTGAFLLQRVGFDIRLARVRDVLSLVAAVVISPLVAATIGVLCLGAGSVQPWSALPSLWWLWWLGDVLGGLIVAPVLLAWNGLPHRRGAITEGVLLLAAVTIASSIAFIRIPLVSSIEYVVFPFLIWAALRFGIAGVATAAIIINVIAIWGTHLGRGPFAGAGPEQGLVLLQVFMAVAATTGLLLGAIAAQNRRAQERAELSEQRLLMALGAARMGVWDWNIETDELTWSVHPDDRERVEAGLRFAVQTGSRYEAQFRAIGADGVTRWIDSRGQVIHDEEGNAVRMVGVAIDVTQQKALEEELRQADRRKDEFLAMLGHELRNPLAPIVHAVDLLGRGDAKLSQRATEIIRRQSEHLSRMVDDLLDVSRITRGTVRLERRLVTLAELVSPAIETWHHVIGQRAQHLQVQLPERTIWLDVDPTRFTQIVANLLHNASKFTPDEGEIAILAEEENGSLALHVRDSGRGMTPDVLAHVFELFVQGSPSIDRPYGGLGVGLTLVRQLVELHGGTVSAASEPDRGTTITLRVPIADAPPEVAQPREVRAAEPAPRSRRVLVVDDNADARKALMLLLEQEGHDVRTAGDGAAALEEAKRFTPEVVLLDIGLPGLDGYAVARQLRATPQSVDVLLVAITGYGQPEDRAQSRAAGFDHHLLKPVELVKLLELVASCE